MNKIFWYGIGIVVLGGVVWYFTATAHKQAMMKDDMMTSKKMMEGTSSDAMMAGEKKEGTMMKTEVMVK
jgi:hypothetical protein